MNPQPRRPLSDDDVRRALTRNPDGWALADNFAQIVAAIDQTRRTRILPARWALIAALLVLALIAAVAVALAVRPRPGIGMVAVDIDFHVFMMQADGSEPEQLSDSVIDQGDWQPLWSPDGSRLVYWSVGPVSDLGACGASCQGVPLRLVMVDLSDPDQPLSSLLTTVSISSNWRVSWAPDSRRLVLGDVINDQRVLVVVDTQTRERNQIGPDDLDGFDPAWSPDGRKIAFVRGHVDPVQRAVYVMDPDGANLGRITSILSRGQGFLEPAWSPSGDQIAFAAETNGYDPFQKDIWLVGLDGSPEVDISNNRADEHEVSWSPDGTKLAYLREVSQYSDRFQIVVSSRDGASQLVLVPVVASHTPVWSPDGAAILAVELGPTGDSPTRVVAINVDSGSEQILANGLLSGPGSWKPEPR